ncbi:sec-independent protein translocase protein TatA [Geomicrobium halophilum]|uniref:Sec-independent protein translocase protein TatA n=1 Tax=Geomicrobium halophilum TaxID=549000 RepID=A0A841Q0Q1_9BACL|nr:twin-arginine translocase TatA/TatE family subunit [Geomicrobium halophilum]MBB6451222.1 sec-independent protein translocase protein TatA [Geomicrobium halophilum]
MNLGFLSLLLIVILGFLIFAPRKLPEMGQAFGRSLKEFKKTKPNMDEEDKDDKKKEDH